MGFWGGEECRFYFYGREDFSDMRLPNPSQVLDKNLAPIGPEILSSTKAGVWGKAPMAFPDSGSVLDKSQSANKGECVSVTRGLLPKLPSAPKSCQMNSQNS